MKSGLGPGPSVYLTVVVFCVGLVTGLIMTSLLSNYTSVSQHMIYPAILKSSAGRELVELVRRYNETLSIHARQFRIPMSHDDVHEHDNLINRQTPMNFKDAAYHNEDDGLAQNLSKTVRVLCWVMTMKSQHSTKATAAHDTWMRRCNKAYLMSDGHDSTLKTILIKNKPGRYHLTAKTMQSFDYIYKHDINNYDWFLKADDDTYVIMENLRYLLMNYSRDEPVFFGHHFKLFVKQGYFSGGGGYVISREALRRFGMRKKGLCMDDGRAEDMRFGKCMEALGVRAGDSRDKLGRLRFHCFSALNFVARKVPKWLSGYTKYPIMTGVANVSDFSISFHYVNASQMYELEFYIYHMQRFGVVNGNPLWSSHESPAKQVLRLLLSLTLGTDFYEENRSFRIA